MVICYYFLLFSSHLNEEVMLAPSAETVIFLQNGSYFLRHLIDQIDLSLQHHLHIYLLNIFVF